MSSTRPIGVFDSGLGGLSVASEVKLRLPHEDLLYIADSAYCPYGGRPLEEITARSLAVTQALVDRGAKLVVAACNTASGAAIERLRETFDVPIVGLEPAVKPAAASTRSGRIAVLATPATLQTERFRRLLDNHGAGVEVIGIPCPGFVELVEAGEVSGERAVGSVRAVLGPTIDGVDRVVLGCTHYPFLREAVAAVVGEGVEILDSGPAVARQVERVLRNHHLLREGDHAGDFHFYTTGDPAAVAPIVHRLWSEPVRVEKVQA